MDPTIDAYMTVANMQHCEGLFCGYMRDKHGMQLDGAKPRVRRLLYAIMKDVRGSRQAGGRAAGMDVRQLNNLTLTLARDVVMRTGGETAAAARVASGPGLERERELFGDRPLPMMPHALRQQQGHAAPAADERASRGETAAKSFETLVSERRALAEPRAPARAEGPPPAAETLEDRPAAEELLRLVERLEAFRGDADAAWAAQLPPPSAAHPEPAKPHEGDPEGVPPPAPELYHTTLADTDPAAMHRAALVKHDEFRASERAAALDQPLGNTRMEAVLPPPPPQQFTTVERHISINGFDRDWTAEPLRFRFTVTFGGPNSNDMAHVPRNIHWLQVTSVVLPIEAPLAPSAAPGGTADFCFAHPYLLLVIDGIDGTYDGTNDVVRRAFCKLVYQRAYRSPSGRGYVLLEAMQHERRYFRPAPLASLRNLRVSLLRPTGALFNNGVDINRVGALEYDVTNRLVLRVVLERFFEPREFAPGDTVIVTGFEVLPPASGDPDPFGYKGLNEFINRREGHEVSELGPANENGFVRSFYILAPGLLDQGVGNVVLDQRIIRCVQRLSDAAAPATLTSPAPVLNMALQGVIALRMGTRQVVDPSDPAVMLPSQPL